MAGLTREKLSMITSVKVTEASSDSGGKSCTQYIQNISLEDDIKTWTGAANEGSRRFHNHEACADNDNTTSTGCVSITNVILI